MAAAAVFNSSSLSFARSFQSVFDNQRAAWRGAVCEDSTPDTGLAGLTADSLGEIHGQSPQCHNYYTVIKRRHVPALALLTHPPRSAIHTPLLLVQLN